MAAETATPKVDRGWVQINPDPVPCWLRARDGFLLASGGFDGRNGTRLYPPGEENHVFSPYSVDAIREALITAERFNPTGEDAHLPEECRAKTCDYYRHYLVFGGPDLTHEGYHAACELADQHMRSCTRGDRGPCSVCQSWEKRVRA